MRFLFIALAVSFIFGCNDRPRRNVAFYMNLVNEPRSLHPLKAATDGASNKVRAYITETLLTRDIDTYEWKQALATEWDISDDNKVFTFKLRKGVKWHDGEEVTAEDVKWSFDAIFDDQYKAVAIRPYYEGIDRVEIVDKYTVKFFAKNEYYQNFDTSASLDILPKHFYEKEEGSAFFNKNIIGTGPYKLELYNRGNRIVLVKNEDWWGDKDPDQKEWNFSKIVLRFVSDSNVEIEMLKKGSLDFIGLQPEQYVKKAVGPKWGKELHKVITRNKTPKGYNFIGWNLKNKILADRQVRLALYKLVNRKLMIDKFEFGYSVPAAGPIYPSSPYHDSSIKPIEFDPVEALKILRGAGWKDTDNDNILDKVIDGKKRKLSITILEPYEGFMKYLTVFKEDAKKAGVEINVKLMEWNSFIKLIDEKKFDAIRMAWSAAVDWDPKQIWHSDSINGGSNFISYSNKEVDELTDKARLIQDRDERIKILRKAERIIANDVPYVWFTYKAQTMYAHTDRIEKEKDTYNYGVGTSFWKFKSEMRKEE